MFAPPKPTMRDFVDRDPAGTAPILDVDEESLYECAQVTLAFDRDTTEGVGSLVVTSRRILWMSDTDSSRAYDFDVPYICLHAISRDESTFSRPCIYCQLAEEEEDLLKEVYFAPGDESALQPIFTAFSRAAELNPDPLEPGEMEGDDELIFNEEEVAMGARQAAILEHLESVFHVGDTVDGQFEDALDETGSDQEELHQNGHDSNMDESGETP